MPVMMVRTGFDVMFTRNFNDALALLKRSDSVLLLLSLCKLRKAAEPESKNWASVH